ncbi:MAG TPA: hypothetical protein VKV95_17420 [Terriglobia bacterium]|nr:hypothetical protein [Terriglobia bacterium]
MTKRFLLLVVLVVCVGLPLAFAQKGAGKPYLARDPKTCDSRKAPEKGEISAAQAAQYLTCDMEVINGFGQLSQVTDVKVEVGKGRPFNINTDSIPDIDVSALVFNIRGSYNWAYCSKVDGTVTVAGKNCSRGPQPAAQGMCYKNNFGDWHCSMRDGAAFMRMVIGPPLE